MHLRPLLMTTLIAACGAAQVAIVGDEPATGKQARAVAVARPVATDAKVPASQPATKTTTRPTGAGADTRPAGRADQAKPGPESPPQERPEDKKAEDIKLPASASPEDIRAVRGAQAMLAAEARLRQQLKDGTIKGIDRILPFEDLSSWPYQDGLKGMPEGVKKLDGLKVMMTGFMLPIDEVENIKQFLLVQSLWSCCFGQPPDINGIVRVVYKGTKRLDYQFEPIKMTGVFRVKATVEDGYCVDIYQLETEAVEVIG